MYVGKSYYFVLTYRAVLFWTLIRGAKGDREVRAQVKHTDRTTRTPQLAEFAKPGMFKSMYTYINNPSTKLPITTGTSAVIHFHLPVFYCNQENKTLDT